MALNITYPAASRYYQINSGSGAASGSWDAANAVHTCSVTGFDDTTIAEWGLGIQNNESFTVNLTVVLPVDTACVNFTEAGPILASIGAGAATAGFWRVAGLPGDAGTLSCASQVLPAFSVDVHISAP